MNHKIDRINILRHLKNTEDFDVFKTRDGEGCCGSGSNTCSNSYKNDDWLRI